MATATHLPLVEYLNTTYRPDREYIDGELEERNIGKRDHARLQAFLAAWFGRYESEWLLITLLSQRIQVTSGRVRIPDVTVTNQEPQPDVLTAPPLLVVEILSPEDTYASLEDRLRDYRLMGIHTVWLVDPATRTARICSGSAWTEVTRLTVPGTPIFLETATLFQQLEQSR